MLGTTLGGKYRIERLLGEGGMGAVYEAMHIGTNRRIALKVISGDASRHNPDVIARFLALPIVVGVLSGFGGDLRFYRTVFVEETGKDYVRTARAKGCGEGRIMGRHVLRNSLIPILTHVVVQIPFLFTGSLLLESFFGIPVLGSVTVDAINANDFSTLRVMVYIGSLLFIAGQIATDVSYTLADPRVRLG